MIDYNVTSTENYFNSMSDDYEQACNECAQRNGLTLYQAYNCEMGKFNCCGCPWGGSEAVKTAFALCEASHEKIK